MSDGRHASQEALTDGPVRSRYVIGIDLGTTNSALCYVDTHQSPWRIETFRITQWVDVGQYELREMLPSFHYELTRDEASSIDWKLPWERSQATSCVGIFARDAGQRHPGRRVSSAKSWLSHDGVDRSADFLPWHGDADVTRLSPVDVSAKYLAHFCASWNHAHPDDPLDQQDVVITLPASFDEVARELTILAAKRTGLRRVYLIEEPQAAFYAWIHSHAEEWQNRIVAGQMILVCDIGGGTTDFTLIRVQPAGDHSDQVQFHRVAVGNHLILGGDNLDLAVAKKAEEKLLRETGMQSLSSDQWDRLVHTSRIAKEAMLSEESPPKYTLSLPSQGSKLIGGAIQVSLSVEEFDETLVEGFFPVVDLLDRPTTGQSGFREFGLPYASDPAVTRHLAAFLTTHRRSGLSDADKASDDRPAWLLFNGGVMAAPKLRARIAESIARWFQRQDESSWSPEILSSPRLDLAVAQGAAYYAMVRRGEGIKIAANLGRSYYIQVASDPVRAICLIPGNAEPGQRFATAEHPLELQIGEPVQFPMWVSSTRLADRAGEIVVIAEGEAARLPPIYTALTLGKQREAKTIGAAIESELSEIGTVGMWCVDLESGKRWQLNFDIRSTLETDREVHQATGESEGIIDSETILRCEAAIATVFASVGGVSGSGRSIGDASPSKLITSLQDVTQMKREAWPASLLRSLWQVLIDHEAGRRLSAQHESRWLNLVGYCLRPGYGVAVDDWRVSKTWKVVYGKIAFAAPQSRIESLVLWRRIAGGMTSGQQQQLADPLINQLRGSGVRLESQEQAERWRLVASLERISVKDKAAVGRAALDELRRKKSEPIHAALLWAIGRLGSRTPIYGPLNATIDREEAERWLTALLTLRSKERSLVLAIVQLARRMNDRHRDLSDQARASAVELLKAMGASDHFVSLVRDGGMLSGEEEAAVFGESLPLGIRLAH